MSTGSSAELYASIIPLSHPTNKNTSFGTSHSVSSSTPSRMYITLIALIFGKPSFGGSDLAVLPRQKVCLYIHIWGHGSVVHIAYIHCDHHLLEERVGCECPILRGNCTTLHVEISPERELHSAESTQRGRDESTYIYANMKNLSLGKIVPKCSVLPMLANPSPNKNARSNAMLCHAMIRYAAMQMPMPMPKTEI